MGCAVTGNPRPVTRGFLPKGVPLTREPTHNNNNARMATAEDLAPRSPGDVEFDDSAAELADRQSSPPRYEIATYPADFTLEVLQSKWTAVYLTVLRFQRKFVWSQAQASKLIESFLVGLPVPAIFLYTERGSEKSLVVDGQQRLQRLR